MQVLRHAYDLNVKMTYDIRLAVCRQSNNLSLPRARIASFGGVRCSRSSTPQYALTIGHLFAEHARLGSAFGKPNLGKPDLGKPDPDCRPKRSGRARCRTSRTSGPRGTRTTSAPRPEASLADGAPGINQARGPCRSEEGTRNGAVVDEWRQTGSATQDTKSTQHARSFSRVKKGRHIGAAGAPSYSSLA